MNDDSSRDRDLHPPETGPGSAPGGRREPVFTDFDEDEDYDEADRDTDYASAYEEAVEDEEYLDSLDEDPADLDDDWQAPGGEKDERLSPAAIPANPWEEDHSVDLSSEHHEEREEYYEEGDEYDPYDDEELDNGDDLDRLDADSRPEKLAGLASANTENGAWTNADDYPDELEELEGELDPGPRTWPIGLVIVGIVALVLLAAGGYGVIQQRAATQEEIRQLQATLATAASPAEVAASREALQTAEEQNAKLRATVERLSGENRRLGDTIAGLEKQLSEQGGAKVDNPAPKAAPTTPAAAPAPSPPPEKPPVATATTAPTGPWFVNFSSYGERSVAENWASKLKPSAGEAVVAPSTRDGRTLYRVRVVGLADKAQAQKVAGELQKAYKLPPLWVGSQ